MPYIEGIRRVKFDKAISQIVETLASLDEEVLAGEMNYCFSKIAWGLFEKKKKYIRINTINGVFTSAQQEFARRKVAPYEDMKIEKNKDI